MKYILFLAAFTGVTSLLNAQPQPDKKSPESTEVWDPAVRVVTPGENQGDAPSDAIVLFDGKNLDQWITAKDGEAARWNLKDGVVSVQPGTGDIKTKREFTDFQLHIEWRTPAEVDPKATGQNRGNSGVFLQGLYEVQILDSYNNQTYSNGQAGSIYKQAIPLVNACKMPGEWQTYDIIFTAPRFDPEGRVIIPAYVTVIHNGALVLNHMAIIGPTEYIGFPSYKPYAKGPIRLQNHGNKVSFRNTWVREL